MEAVPAGYVPYRVRELRTGEISYFNYVLAKEMGLISARHPHELTDGLKDKLISTFSIQIINEFDELSRKRIDAKTIKPHTYMASRYLQLQHSSRSGKTSGDGRGIWNGIVKHQGQVWDVSSRGTGVTCLAPGAVEAKRPLKTGGTEFGYGCGLAEIDELYGAAIMAEVMHLQGFKTERVLAIIDLGNGHGIGVRAAPNLIRPAHLFLYLKQNRWTDLKAAADFLLERQIQNKVWNIKAKGEAKYNEMAKEAAVAFAKFAAHLDVNYIFAWLDWDGDNVLSDAGIIDYGSVRQFGIRHDLYRYDDVQRFSTNLNEQRKKARLIAQVFVQMADYLITKRRQPLSLFENHPTVQLFDRAFERERSERILFRLGLNSEQRSRILAKPKIFRQFDQIFSLFERTKVSAPIKKVADGVNRPALFDLRPLLRELPKTYLLKGFSETWMAPETFFRAIVSDFAGKRDMKIKGRQVQAIFKFQTLYKQLLTQACGKANPSAAELEGIIDRANRINRSDRITGNALINIVEEIIAAQKRGLSHHSVQQVIDQLIARHLDVPEVNRSQFYKSGPQLLTDPDLLNRIIEYVHDHRHDI